jgi:excisionase family DNA binding protein
MRKAPRTQLEIPEAVAVDEVARRLGVSGWTVRTWLRQGRIPYYRFGRRLLVKIDDVARLLEENYQPATRAATENGTRGRA